MQDEGDVVNDQWVTRHGIAIPRAAGVFQSQTGWVKIDGRGTIIAAGERDQTVLAWLVEKKTLSSADVDYGIAYVTCRSADRAYRRQMGYKSSLDLSCLGGGTGLTCEQAAQVFSLVRRELGQHHCSTVEYACDTVRTAETKTPHYPAYRKAFTALAKAFDHAVREVREGRVSDEPQPRCNKSLAPRTRP